MYAPHRTTVSEFQKWLRTYSAITQPLVTKTPLTRPSSNKNNL